MSTPRVTYLVRFRVYEYQDGLHSGGTRIYEDELPDAAQAQRHARRLERYLRRQVGGLWWEKERGGNGYLLDVAGAFRREVRETRL